MGGGKKGTELLANLSEIVSPPRAQLVLVVASTRATSSRQGLVVAKVRDVGQGGRNIGPGLVRRAAPGHEESTEEAHAGRGGGREGDEGVGHEVRSLSRTRPSDRQAIGAVGVEQVHLPPAQARPDHQAVEHARLSPGVYGGIERVHQPRPARAEVETRRRHGRTYAQADVVDEHVPVWRA